MKINACGASHVGNHRKHNEDNIYVDGSFRNDVTMNNTIISSKRTAEPYTYAVFDGLGGEACGEQASLIAALGLKAMEDRGAAADADEFVAAAHKTVLVEAIRKDARNMGTTAAVVHIRDEKAQIFNVGDSRVYLYRDGKLTQMSRDHSVVQSMIECGFITEEERYSSRHSGELTQYIGMDSDEGIDPDAYKTEVRLLPGDVIMLCSDGLSGELRDSEISEILERDAEKDAKYTVLDLIKSAVDKSGRDNISVVVCRIL